jgi:hypothetical protein
MGRKLSTVNNSVTKFKRIVREWEEVEDDSLRLMVQKHGNRPWTLIAKRMSHMKILRGPYTAKMVRERWFNHLDPNINKGPWTLAEEIQLVDLAINYNMKWSKVSKCMAARTEHMIKNRFLQLRRDCSKLLQSADKEVAAETLLENLR